MATLNVVTPQGPVVEREVDEVTVPGAEGEFGVLEGHLPFVCASKTGVLVWRKGGERGRVALGPGFVEVDGRGAIDVLVQRALPSDKIRADDASRLRGEAEARLRKEEDRVARADLEWADAQLRAVEHA